VTRTTPSDTTGEPARRPARDDALALTRHALLTGERIDMQRFAQQLGVNRVTLYRWVGSRDQLVVEALWDLTDRLIRRISGEMADRPGSRVPAVLEEWTRATIETPGMRYFLHGQSEWAMRLLTLHAGGFQPRLLELVEELIGADIREGRVRSPLPLPELAYTVVRVCESYIYLPAITGDSVHPEVLRRVLDVLLPDADVIRSEGHGPQKV
jgi:AcrR family transcriptional regulator